MAWSAERCGVWVLGALAPVAMLAVDPLGWYPFGPVKWIVVSTFVLVGAVLVLRRLPIRLPDAMAGAVALFLGWLGLAAIVGEDPLYAWIGTPERRFGVVTWALCALLLVIGRCLDVGGHGRIVVNGLLVAGVGVGAVATLEAVGWEPDVLDVGSRLTGTFGSSAYLGASTALLLPIALGVALGAGRLRRRLIAATAVPLLTVACLGSGARAAWFGLGVAGVVTAIASGRSLLALVREHPRRTALLGLGVVVAAAGLLVLTPVGSRLEDATDSGNAGGRGRVDEWQVGADVLRGHPVFGVGPEGYRVAFHEGADADYSIVHGREVQPDRAHNGPLDLALAGGLPVLLPWGLLAWFTARSAWSALHSGPGWLRGVAAGLVAHGVGQLLFFPIVELEPVVWLLAGLLLAARPHGAARRRRRSRQRSRPIPLPVLGVLALGALVAAVSGVTEILADHRADDAVEALGRGDHRSAADAADAAADLRPDVVRLHLLAARTAVADDQGFQTALSHVEDALDVSPEDPIVLLTRATYLVERAEATGTRSHIVDAVHEVERRIREDPSHPAYWRLGVRVAELAGDSETAEKARENAELLDSDDDEDG